MADNIATTPGSGATIAADDVGGILHQRVKLGLGADGAAADLQGPDADGLAASRNLPAGGMLWNGASWDRERGNTEGSLLTSAARTTSTTSASQTNYNARGAIVLLSITAASGTGGLQLTFNAYINGSINVRLTTLPTAITATGLYAYEIYPGSTTTAPGPGTQLVQQRTSAVLPRTWSITVTHGDGSSYTYQVDYSLIL